MKYFRYILVLLVLLMTPSGAFAAGSFSYEAEAQVLNDLGLYKGISETEFNPDLGSALNRETGVVMLLRIFGLQDEAEAITDADATLAKFSDVATISSWAKNAVAYAVKNGLVKGMTDSTFGPKAALNGKAYSTLILRQLGYTPDYANAPAELADKGGLSVSEAVKFTEKSLIKDDLIGISYGALKAEYSDGPTVIEKLVEDKVVEEAKAGDLLETDAKKPVVEPAIAAPKITDAKVISWGTLVVVTFDKDMPDFNDKKSEFTLTIDNNKVDIESIALNPDNSKIVSIRFVYDIYAESPVNLAYAKGTVKSKDGGELESFSMPVKNECFMKKN
jgi:hypothetical protein